MLIGELAKRAAHLGGRLPDSVAMLRRNVAEVGSCIERLDAVAAAVAESAHPGDRGAESRRVRLRRLYTGASRLCRSW